MSDGHDIILSVSNPYARAFRYKAMGEYDMAIDAMFARMSSLPQPPAPELSPTRSDAEAAHELGRAWSEPFTGARLPDGTLAPTSWYQHSSGELEDNWFELNNPGIGW